MSDILKAILFGIVEGITEWLPISSTGHMILVEEFVKMHVSEEFWSLFLVVIQLGAIMAVVILFWNKIWPFGRKKKNCRFYVKTDIIMLWLKILAACIPAAIVGVLFDDKLDELFYHPWCVAIALIVFGIAFIIIENRNKNHCLKGDHVSDGGADRYISADRGGFSGDFPLGGDDRGSPFDRRFENCGGGIYIFPCDSRDVWGEPFKGSEVRACVYGNRAGFAGCGNGCGISGFDAGDPFSDGLYQKT